MLPRSSDCPRGPGSCGCTRAGRPTPSSRSSPRSAPRPGRGPGLLGRAHDPDDCPRTRPPRAQCRRAPPAGPARARDRAAWDRAAYAGLPHTYRSWLLRISAILWPRRSRAPDSSWPKDRRSGPSASSTWPTVCSGPVTWLALPSGWRSPRRDPGPGGSTTSGGSTSAGGCSWPGSRSPSRTPRPRSRRRSRWLPPPRSAVTPATRCWPGWSVRRRRRGSGCPSTASSRRRPRRPGRSGRARGLVARRRRRGRDQSPHARAAAARLADHVAREAAERGELRTFAAARLS